MRYAQGAPQSQDSMIICMHVSIEHFRCCWLAGKWTNEQQHGDGSVSRGSRYDPSVHATGTNDGVWPGEFSFAGDRSPCCMSIESLSSPVRQRRFFQQERIAWRPTFGGEYSSNLVKNPVPFIVRPYFDSITAKLNPKRTMDIRTKIPVKNLPPSLNPCH